jgi:CheY-like chemotaxis protein
MTLLKVRRHGGHGRVALTAYAGPKDRRRALLAGSQTHLAKPVEPGELLAVVATLGWHDGRV